MITVRPAQVPKLDAIAVASFLSQRKGAGNDWQ